MNYYNEIKNRLIKSEIYDRARDYSKDRHKVRVYFEIGQLLNKAGKEYGKNIIKQYSEKLMIEVGKKYNERNLRYMRQFYEMLSETKWNAVRSKLCWSHYREVLSIKDINEIRYYLNECENKNLSQRQLHEMIKQKYYRRLSNETKNKLTNNKQLKLDDLIPNPIILKSNNLNQDLSEYALKELILNNIDEFLLQLGRGFAYVGNEFKFKIDSRYNYIDLLLFNYEFNCFVVVELKSVELKKEHIGQIQIYMNYINKNLKRINQSNTIGIIICKQENKYVIKYCSDDRIIAREYQLM